MIPDHLQSLSLAATVNVVLYDRLLKRGWKEVDQHSTQTIIRDCAEAHQ